MALLNKDGEFFDTDGKKIDFYGIYGDVKYLEKEVNALMRENRELREKTEGVNTASNLVISENKRLMEAFTKAEKTIWELRDKIEELQNFTRFEAMDLED
jgi:predicted nuclease with TOPRIM domain